MAFDYKILWTEEAINNLEEILSPLRQPVSGILLTKMTIEYQHITMLKLSKIDFSEWTQS
jgi:hypothetical protein